MQLSYRTITGNNLLPTSFKEKYKEIPWKQIAGMRDKLVHEYFGVDYKLLWETVKVYVPELKRQIEEIVKKEGWKPPQSLIGTQQTF